MKTEKERYEAPTIQIVEAKMQDFLCISTTHVSMYFLSQPDFPSADGQGGFGDTWNWD